MIVYIALVCQNNEGYYKLLPHGRPEIIQVISEPFWRDLDTRVSQALFPTQP